jgi:hypothetical protein
LPWIIISRNSCLMNAFGFPTCGFRRIHELIL